jgi:diguanylate cyclase (GGDEF)-like protein
MKPVVPKNQFNEHGLAGLTPQLREQLLQQIDENRLLAAALSGMRDRVEELEKLVDTDTLTPLPNRRHFLRELERTLEHVRRHDLPAFIMFADLDGLKAINDQYGHLAGDAALIEVAHRLQDGLRKTDFVARIGGDEYGLILAHLTEAAAQEKAMSLISAITDRPLDLGGQQLSLQISLGLSRLFAEDTPTSAIARADAAMYAVRRAKPYLSDK